MVFIVNLPFGRASVRARGLFDAGAAAAFPGGGKFPGDRPRADGLSGTSTGPAASNRRFGWEMRRMAYAGNDDAGARRGPIASLAPAEAT